MPFVYDTTQPDVLRLEGEINSRTPLSLRLALGKYPEITTISLSSPGGQVMAALPTALDIRAAGLKTTIPAGGKCFSACSLMFFAGIERAAAGELGVHQVTAENAASGQFAVGDIIAVLDEFKVPSEVIVKMLQTLPSQMYVMDPAEMARLGLLGVMSAQGATNKDFAVATEQPVTQPVQPVTRPVTKPLQPITQPLQPVTPPVQESESGAPVCYVDDVRPPDAWLALRTEPSSRAGRQLQKLLPGQSFVMLGSQSGDWHLVRLPDGTTGWVSWQVSRWIRC
ncbi:MAG: SH3 domain-containing protein [Alphaproteobacteria bacterium]|nr:SH3 domain-containing protein [Alphaproteobacteria bacterium]